MVESDEITEWDMQLVRETYAFYDDMLGHYTSIKLQDLEVYTRAELPYNMRKSVCCPTRDIAKNPLFLQTLLFLYAQVQNVTTLIAVFPFSRESIREWIKRAINQEVYWAFWQDGFCALCGIKIGPDSEEVKAHLISAHLPYLERRKRLGKQLEDARAILLENKQIAKEQSQDGLASVFKDLADKLGGEIKEILLKENDEDDEESEDIWE